MVSDGPALVILTIVLTIGVPMVLAVAATVALGRREKVASEEYDSDSVSFVGGVLAALFTVVLAFYVVFAWQIGDDIESNSTAEADALVDAFWQAELAPEPARTELQELVRSYASRIVSSEWDLLAAGRTDPAVDRTVEQLRARFAALPAEPAELGVAREQALLDVKQLDENHRARVSLVTDGDTFNVTLLGASIFGAAIMLVFPLLAGLGPRPANVAVMALHAMTLGATVLLSIQLLYPLDGVFAVEPDAFRAVLDLLSRPTS